MTTSAATSATSSDTMRQVLVVVAYVSTIVVNSMATLLPINNKTTGELSDNFEIFITPAGYVFSIWSIIYLGLMAYSIYQAQPAQKTNPRLRAIGWLFIFSCFANMAWIFVWHYEMVPASLAVMLVILVPLVTIYIRLAARPDSRYNSVTTGERWTVHLPFRIYLGWITVATIVNTTTILDYFGWEGGGIAPELWTAIMVGVGMVVALFFTVRQRDWIYGMVIVWAFAGIAAKHGDVTLVAGPALGAAAIIALSILAIAWQSRLGTHKWAEVRA